MPLTSSQEMRTDRSHDDLVTTLAERLRRAGVSLTREILTKWLPTGEGRTSSTADERVSHRDVILQWKSGVMTSPGMSDEEVCEEFVSNQLGDSISLVDSETTRLSTSSRASLQRVDIEQLSSRDPAPTPADTPTSELDSLDDETDYLAATVSAIDRSVDAIRSGARLVVCEQSPRLREWESQTFLQAISETLDVLYPHVALATSTRRDAPHLRHDHAAPLRSSARCIGSLLADAIARQDALGLADWAFHHRGARAEPLLEVHADDVYATLSGDYLRHERRRRILPFAIALALSGIPAIDPGITIGRATPTDGFDLDEIERQLRDPWSDEAWHMEAFFDLMHARTANDAFDPHGTQEILDLGSDVFALRRTSATRQSRVLALHNVTPTTVELPLGAPRSRDLLTARVYTSSIPLGPYDVAWLLEGP